jgi:hypothetical protein
MINSNFRSLISSLLLHKLINIFRLFILLLLLLKFIKRVRFKNNRLVVLIDILINSILILLDFILFILNILIQLFINHIILISRSRCRLNRFNLRQLLLDSLIIILQFTPLLKLKIKRPIIILQNTY